MFDVTNGIYWLKDLVLKIVIIPENLYMKTQTLHVEEGKFVKLLPECMTPYSEYYVGKVDTKELVLFKVRIIKTCNS